MKKRGISPLVSTVILIGFAIALGGVIMSWGRASYTGETVIGCSQTSLSLISYGENKGVCNKDGRLYFTIQNNGGVMLDGVGVSLLGDDIYSAVIEKEIGIAEIVKLDMEYNIGKIEKVIFTPRLGYSAEGMLCPKNGFSIENIGEC